MTEKLKKLMSLCKCGVHVDINPHRDFYESVEQYAECALAGGDDEINPEVFKKMIETDTFVQVQCYPNTPIGFYQTFHYDIDAALDEAIANLEP